MTVRHHKPAKTLCHETFISLLPHPMRRFKIIVRLIRYRHLLQGSNKQISDQVLTNHTFNSIPKTYEGVIDTLQHLPPAEETLDYVIQRLVDLEKTKLTEPVGDPIFGNGPIRSRPWRKTGKTWKTRRWTRKPTK